jgi:hypothetical protein
LRERVLEMDRVGDFKRFGNVLEVGYELMADLGV